MPKIKYVLRSDEISCLSISPEREACSGFMLGTRVVALVGLPFFSVRHGLRIVTLHSSAAPPRVLFGGRISAGRSGLKAARKHDPICEKTSQPFVWRRCHVSTVRVASH